jgi:hypothetical protein
MSNFGSVGIAIAVVGAVVLSCSAPDPGEIIFKERRSPITPATTAPPVGDPDAGGGDSGPPPSAFSGAPAYAPGDPGGEAKTHPGGHKGFPGAPNPADQNCITAPGCHKKGGAGPTFTFGGTIQGAKGIEIRMVDAVTGKEIGKTYTDVDGNFWYANGELPAGKYKVGIRNTTDPKPANLMSGTDMKSGGCADTTSACHSTAGIGRIKLN